MTQGSPEALPARHHQLVPERLVLAYFIAALTYFAVSLLGGLLMALQLVRHNPLAGMEIFSPGRWRMVHTNAIAYGFIANAFLGVLHWAIPRLTLKPVLSVRLSWFIFAAWQVVVLSTAAGILLGPTLGSRWIQAQGVEWGETPMLVDPLAQTDLLLVMINFLAPILRTRGPMYVSLWSFMAAFPWTFLTYAMGNFIPQYFLAGTGGGAVAGLFIHDLVGLFVTPIGWGMMYYFVPILLKRPMWSHGLSLVGFWGLAFFYPLTGIHHFLYTPIPMFLQYGAVISTIAVEFVVATVIINFAGTAWGKHEMVYTNLPLRWFFTGAVFYFVTCLQCAFQVTLTFQALIHFTDWVVAHAHLVMLGVFAFWIFGAMTYLFPRLLGAEWYSERLLEYHFWLSAGGMLVMFLDLTFAGLFQGWSWSALQVWEDSLRVSMPFWIVRVVAGLAIMTGQVCFGWNLYRTWQLSRQKTAPTEPLAA